MDNVTIAKIMTEKNLYDLFGDDLYNHLLREDEYDTCYTEDIEVLKRELYKSNLNFITKITKRKNYGKQD